jgi:hypothetical protein
MALFAHGLFDARKNDGFGAGFYYYGISDLLTLHSLAEARPLPRMRKAQRSSTILQLPQRLD